jgi:glycosyltransferase involved in cell wall biosynthesis
LKTIATNALGYNQYRNFASLNLPNYRFKKVWDLFRIINYFYYRTTHKVSDTLLNSFVDLGLNSVHLYHFMNAVPLTHKPFVITIERQLPRLSTQRKWYKKWLASRLTKPNCVQIVAFSEFAKRMCTGYLKKHYPEYAPKIVPKITTIHPAQRLYVQRYEDKNITENEIVFSFVGADFFRKGGKEILQVFDALLTQRQPVRLNIVSTLQYADYATQATYADQQWALAIIQKYPEDIHYHRHLPNEEIVKLFEKTHICLLPTYAETYGYTVLEAQACGCPAITTDIESLPEINNDDLGWSIKIDQDALGYSLHQTQAQRAAVSAQISEQLKCIIENILQNPALIANKANKSIEKIKKQHNFDTISLQMAKIYDQALNQ